MSTYSLPDSLTQSLHAAQTLHFTEHEGSEPPNCPCSQPDESSLHPPIMFILRSLLINTWWKIIKIYNILEVGSLSVFRQG
jgi:hypothetical protein